MRTIQMLGFLLALSGFVLGYLFLNTIDSDTSGSAASALGLGLMGIVAPLLCLSALLLLPSSLALVSSRLRSASYFSGKFWLSVWGINILISLCYLFVFGYVLYNYLHNTAST